MHWRHNRGDARTAGARPCHVMQAAAEGLLILNFPANPTTQCVELSFFERIVALCRDLGIYIVHDLASADIVFDGYRAPSVLEVAGAKDIAVEFFTLSKSYNMPGWRVGFMVGNPRLVTALGRIKSYFDYGTFTPIQVAAISALEGPQDCVAEIRDIYKDRRDVLVPGLNKLGGRWNCRRRRCSPGRRFPSSIVRCGSVEFFKEAVAGGKGRSKFLALASVIMGMGMFGFL